MRACESLARDAGFFIDIYISLLSNFTPVLVSELPTFDIKAEYALA